VVDLLGHPHVLFVEVAEVVFASEVFATVEELGDEGLLD
jgi:hypothetical protein